MSERSSLREREDERDPELTEEATDPCAPCAGEPWNCEDLSTNPVYKTAANSALLIFTFVAFIGFCYCVWLGVQAYAYGLGSLDWDAFREAVEYLKKWIRYPTSSEELEDDQDKLGENSHQKGNQVSDPSG